jgi:hypothetical protein
MDNNDALAAQRTLCGMSDKPGQWRDGLDAFRALCRAQADASSGDSDDDGSPMTWKF